MVLATLLSLAALGQVVLSARLVEQVAGELASTRVLLGVETVDFAPAAVAAEAHHALPRLAAGLPGDARVLLVSGHPLPVQFEYYFLPRPFRLLQRFDRSVYDAAEARWPELAEPIRQARERMQQLGLELTPERLTDALDHADYLVTFLLPEHGAEGVTAARPGLTFERLDGNAQATLYRLVRGD